MLERIVNARRNLRFFKNLVRGRTLERSEPVYTDFLDTISPYLTGYNIQIFGIDTDGRVHMFSAVSYHDLVAHSKTINELGLEQRDFHYQKFSGSKTTRHYFDANFENDGYKLKLIARIKGYKN